MLYMRDLTSICMDDTDVLPGFHFTELKQFKILYQIGGDWKFGSYHGNMI